MKKTTRTARKVLSVFLAVLMMLTTWAVAAPGLVLAADSYYVRVYLNIYDGANSDGYENPYTVVTDSTSEFYGKPDDYKWDYGSSWSATDNSKGYDGEINMAGFTLFYNDDKEYKTYDLASDLVAATTTLGNNWTSMDDLTLENFASWPNKVEKVYSFELDSLPSSLFWVNDENNAINGETSFGFHKITVAESSTSQEHVLWTGLSGSESYYECYYGTITPTGIITPWDDCPDASTKTFYKDYTTSAIGTWFDPFKVGAYNIYPVNNYLSGGVSVSFTVATSGYQTDVDYIDVGNTNNYYINFTNHSTQTARITELSADSLLTSSIFSNGNNVIESGKTKSIAINKANMGKTDGLYYDFGFKYTLDNVYESNGINLTTFEQAAGISIWDTSGESSAVGKPSSSEANDGFTIYNGNDMDLQHQFVADVGLFDTVSTTNNRSSNVSFTYNYYLDNPEGQYKTWQDIGLRMYVKKYTYDYTIYLQKQDDSTCDGTLNITGEMDNKNTVSISIADLLTSWPGTINVPAASPNRPWAFYNTPVRPFWGAASNQEWATITSNVTPAYFPFCGELIKGSTTSTNPGKIEFNQMTWVCPASWSWGTTRYADFTGTINVYVFDKSPLRDYLYSLGGLGANWAPMSTRFDSAKWNAYKTAYKNAVTVLANQRTNQKDVTDAYNALYSATEALKNTANLVNQIADTTYTQRTTDYDSAVVSGKETSKYLVMPIGTETAVPSYDAYKHTTSGNVVAKQSSNLKTNYTQYDTGLNPVDYRYWKIDFTDVDEALAAATELLNTTLETYSDTYYEKLQNARTALSAVDRDADTYYPTHQSDVTDALNELKALLAHSENDDSCKFVVIKSVAANCTDRGYNLEACSVCGKERTVYTTDEASGHGWEETAKQETDNDVQHYYDCEYCEEKFYADHSFGYVTVDPTYEAPGSVTGTCAACGYKTVEDIPQLVDGAAPAFTFTGTGKQDTLNFYKSVNVTITDDRSFTLTVTKDGEAYTVDDNASFTLTEAGVYEITATDASGNTVTKTVTVNNEHTVETWTPDGDNHIGECVNCGETVTAAHTFENPELARPTFVDGVWVDGTYTYTCVCGAEKVEPAVRADYSALEEAVKALEEIDTTDLSADIKKEIANALDAAEELADNLVKSEQDQIDALVKELQKVKTDVDKAIEDAGKTTKPVTDADSGVHVQFLEAEGIGAVEYVQLGENGDFEDIRMRVTNGNEDLPIIVTGITADKAEITSANSDVIASGEYKDYTISAPADFKESGIITYTITYTIDGLKDADGNPVEFTTKAYLYVKAAAYQPYHYVDEDCANGSATSEWAYSLEATVGDFALVYNYKAPKAEFGNDNLKREKALALSNFTYYDYEDDQCYAGCSDAEWKKGDAHAATYRYYIDTSLAATWQEAGLIAAFAETDKSNYDNAAIEYIRLANNEAYLAAITGSDKTFSVRFTPGKSTNVPNMTWSKQTAGDMAVAEYINPDQNNYLFGQKLVDDGKELNTAYAVFTGEIPQETETAKLMFSPRLVYKKAAEGFLGIQGAQNEAVTMTTHLYITSYNKAELREAVLNAEQAGYNSEYFDADKYEACEEALKNAKEVLGKAETNQTEVDAATKALNDAIADLKADGAEAKFVLTVTHSIYEGKEKSGDATETEYDYYLVNGAITPAQIDLTDRQINKKDDIANLNVTADAEHTYNYWYINYAAAQDAIDAAEEIIANADDYSDKFVEDVTAAKEALENSMADEKSPASQDDADALIGALTDLTGHECETTVELTQRPTQNADGTWNNGTYTETCDTCGAKETYDAVRADYTDFDKALAALEAYLTDDRLTDAAKAELSNIVNGIKDGTYTLDIDADGENDMRLDYVVAEQDKVNVLTEVLNYTVETTKNNIANGTLAKPDSSAAEEAVEEAEALEDKIEMPQADKDAIADLRDTLDDILDEIAKDDNATKAEYQERLDAVEKAANKILEKYKDCKDGHTWGEPVLARPTQNADGTWVDGTYTYTCENCGTTKTEAAERADYTAYDKAVADLNALLVDETLTDAAKAEIEAVLEANEIADNLVTAEQKTVDDAAAALKVVLDKIANDTTGAYEKVDYTAYDAAVDAYEALDEVMTDADKAAVEAIKAEIAEIPADGTKKDYQAQVDKAAADIAAINAKYGDCANGNHTWGEPVLTTAPTADAKGEYTETCGICGTTQKTEVDLADYSEFNTVVGQLEDLLDTENLTDEAKAAIEDALADAEALDKNLPADAETADGKEIKGGQDEIDALVNELKDVVADTNAAIADGSALKPDYEAWEQAETAYDALDKTNVKAEIVAEANGLKNTIADKQADDTLTQATATQDDIDDATARLNEIIAGINDGSLKNPADFTEAEKDLADAKDKAENNDVVDGVKEDIQEIEDKLEALEGANADKQGEIDALEKELEEIIAGITDGSLVKPDYEAWEQAETAYDALDKTNVKAEIVTEAEALKAEIAEKQADDTLTQATATQKDIDDATARLNEIVAGINDGSLKNPADFTEAEKDLADAKDKANKNDVVNGVKEDIKEIEDKLEALEGANADKQGEIDALEKELEEIIAGITDGSLVKPDYDAWEEAEGKYDALDKTNVKAEIVTEAANLKNTIAGKQSDDTLTQATATQDDIDDATARLNEIIAGINDGSLKNPADFTEAEKDLADAKDKADKNDVVDGVKEDIQEIEDKLNELKNDPTTNADDQEEINKLEKELEDIIADIENGTLVKPDYTEWETAENAYDALDKTNVKAEIVTEAANLKNTIADKQADETLTQATATQKDIDDATARLNEIIAGINDGSLKNPADFTEVNKDLADAKDKADKNDVVDGVKDDIQKIEDKLNEIKNDPATNADDQEEINKLEEELEEIIAGITDGTLVKPDYTNYNNAVNAYENLKDKMSADDKAAVEAIKAEIAEIPADGTKKDYQAQIDKAAEDIAAINAKYADCADGNHTWGEPVLTTAPTADAKGEYTETCEICGTTQKTEVDLADYSEFNTVVGQLEDLLDTENLTDEAKAAIEDALADAEALDKNLPADATTADGKEIKGGQDEIDALVEELKGVVTNTNNGITNGTLVYVDLDAYNEAVGIYDNATVKVAKAEDKAVVDALKLSISGIPEGATKAEYQAQVDNATAIIEGINAKYADCTDGNHAYGDPVLTKEPTADAKGEYTYTCGTCGDTKTVEVAREDYSDYDEAVSKAEDMLDDATLTDDAKDAIREALEEAEKLEQNLPADVVVDGETIIDNNNDETIENATDALNGVLDSITNDTTGAYKLPDYDAWEEAETAYDALDKTNVKAEVIDRVNELKAEIADKQADDKLTQATATQKDIDDATAELNAIIAGIKDGSLKNPDYSDVEDKLDEANGNGNLNKDTQDKLDEIEDALEEIKTKTEPEANAKDDQDEVDALEEQLDEILKDIENGTATAPDYTAWDNAEDVYDDLDKTNVAEELINEVTELKNTINELKADPTANAADDQDAINDATARLNEIIAEINGILTEKPDFTEWNKAENAYDDLAKDRVKESILEEAEALKEQIEALENDPTATKVDDQDAIDDATARLNEIIAGIKDGSLKDPDYTGVDKDLADVKDLVSKNDVFDEVKETITNIEETLNDIKGLEEPGANENAHQSTIDALEKRLEEIIAGIENGSLVKPDFTEADKDLADAKDKANNNDVIAGVKEEIAEIEKDLNEIRNDKTANKANDQDDVNKLEERLEDIIAGIEDGSLIKPDYSDAETVIENAEDLSDKLSESEKENLKNLKEALEDIKEDPTSNKKDNQDDVDAIEDAVQSIIDKYADCLNGNHNWSDPVLTKVPTEAEQGEYTETCGTCGETQITKVDRADYDEFDAAVEALEELAKTENLTDAAKAALEDAIEKADKLNKNLPADATTADGKVIKGGQDEIDALVDELNKVVADTNAGIADDSLIKPDYTEVDKDLADAKDKVENNDVIDGVEEEIKEIEDKLNEIKNDPTSNKKDDQDDVDKLEDRLEEIIAGIEDGSLIKPDYSGADDVIKEAEKDIDGGDLSDEDKAALEELKKELEDIKKDPTSNKKDDQGDVDSIKDAVQTIVDKYTACANGNHNFVVGTTVAPNCTDKGYTNYICTVCGKTEKADYVDALGHTAETLFAVEPTCSSVGYTEGQKCIICGEILVAQQEIAKLPHTDADDDGECDVCHQGGLYDGCVCLCHNSHWFWRFVYMIIRIVWKIFGIHPTCACGRVHY